MSVVAFLTALAELGVLALKEYFAHRARERKAEEKWEAETLAFDEIMQQALTKMQVRAAEDAANARRIEDQMDAELDKMRRKP